MPSFPGNVRCSHCGLDRAIRNALNSPRCVSRQEVAMLKKPVLVSAFVCLSTSIFVPGIFAQDKPKDAQAAPAPEFKIPPEDSKKTNPLKNDASAVADGKKLFSSQCFLCHGKDGDGKGELAQDMKLTLHDYHDSAALKGMTDGDLFYILSKGKGEMPGQDDRLTETQRWHLIVYIRSLAGKAMPAAAATSAKEEKKAD
jgi:mono/diheme cytochrome c family protein